MHRKDNIAFYSGIAFSAAGLGNLLMARNWGKIADKHGYVKILVILLFVAGLFRIFRSIFHDKYIATIMWLRFAHRHPSSSRLS